MKKNKGFSLVELIIVIAIMAILIGIMAPQLIRYIERTNVSADVQLCDSVHTALVTALFDPNVAAAEDYSIQWREQFTTPNNDFRLDAFGGQYLTSVFHDEVKDELGFDPFLSATNNFKYMKSKPANTNGILCVKVSNTGASFAVYIANSDMTGRGTGHNPLANTYSYDTIDSTNMIFSK